MARIGLGEGRGWIELHTHGEAEIFSPDYPEPLFTFNADDADLLSVLGKELSAMTEAWKQHQLERPEITNPARMSEGDEDDDLDDGEGEPTGNELVEMPARKMAPVAPEAATPPPAGRQARLGLVSGAD